MKGITAVETTQIPLATGGAKTFYPHHGGLKSLRNQMGGSPWAARYLKSLYRVLSPQRCVEKNISSIPPLSTNLLTRGLVLCASSSAHSGGSFGNGACEAQFVT